VILLGEARGPVFVCNRSLKGGSVTEWLIQSLATHLLFEILQSQTIYIRLWQAEIYLLASLPPQITQIHLEIGIPTYTWHGRRRSRPGILPSRRSGKAGRKALISHPPTAVSGGPGDDRTRHHAGSMLCAPVTITRHMHSTLHSVSEGHHAFNQERRECRHCVGGAW
jgi:hypothetical protein